jgi:hypothetical protein
VSTASKLPSTVWTPSCSTSSNTAGSSRRQPSPNSPIRNRDRNHKRPPLHHHQPAPAAFLSLPGELRNRIYRFALTGPRTIEIDKTRWSTHQPALLKTCKTIRAEALRLFYIENKISTNIHDWDPIVKYCFQQLMTSHNIRPQQLHHYFTGVPSYQNLYQWLQAVHQGRIGAISDAVGKPRPMERKIVGVMFKIVRKATGVSAWSQVEDLLVAHRELLGVGDARWMVDPEDDKGKEGDAKDTDPATAWLGDTVAALIWTARTRSAGGKSSSFFFGLLVCLVVCFRDFASGPFCKDR